MSYADGFINHEGFRVLEHRLLPVDALADACNVETREEVKVEGGWKIESIMVGNLLYVSKEVYERMRKL